MDKNKIREYFNYSDRLRTYVSIITGILIVVFNIFSGFLTVNIISNLLLGIKNPDTILLLVYIIPGVIAGAGILKLCILIMEFLLGGVEPEKYTYLRIVLLISIVLYFIILLFFIITILISFIDRKMTIPGIL